MSWWQRLIGGERRRRVSGYPTSGNGASSFHLWWELPYAAKLTEVSAVLEVVVPPQVDRLYFWALQVSFSSPEGGGAHIGLQHHPNYPGSCAVNWGGYAPNPPGGLLTGSPSELPSTPNDLNTRDFLWYPNWPYRLRVSRVPNQAPEGWYAWRGTVEDVQTGEVTVVRDLFSRGRYLRGPVAWTECFARCDGPMAAVRWSELEAVDHKDNVISVDTVSVNYQSYAAGGCDNTNVTSDGGGWVQMTNMERTSRTAARLTLG